MEKWFTARKLDATQSQRHRLLDGEGKELKVQVPARAAFMLEARRQPAVPAGQIAAPGQIDVVAVQWWHTLWQIQRRAIFLLSYRAEH